MRTMLNFESVAEPTNNFFFAVLLLQINLRNVPSIIVFKLSNVFLSSLLFSQCISMVFCLSTGHVWGLESGFVFGQWNDGGHTGLP